MDDAKSDGEASASCEFLKDGRKDCSLAVILNIIVCCIPGFGQIYLGQTGKGLLFIAVSLFSWILIGFITFLSSLISIVPFIGVVIGGGMSFICFLVFIIPHSLAVFEAVAVCRMLNRGEKVPVNYWALSAVDKLMNK